MSSTADATSVQHALDKALDGQRLSPEEGVELFSSTDLIALGSAADEVRRRLHPEGYVTFVIDRNINYSNVCVSQCRFCAFYRGADHPEAYLLSRDELFQKIRETIELGGTQILMQGGLHPELPLEYYLDMLRSIKANFDIHIHSFSPPEIIHFARISAKPLPEVVCALRDAGLDSIPGGGAEILSDRVRRHVSPNKCTTDEWLEVMRTAHQCGMKTTATMMFGHVDKIEDRVEHFVRIRRLQDETGGFTAFIPWTFQPMNTALNLQPAGGFEYLKTLAISRLMLDNFTNIQASWVTQGAKVAQLALKFGANDMGSTMVEENVVRAAGVEFRMPLAQIIAVIEDLGFQAKQRDCYYNIIEKSSSLP